MLASKNDPNAMRIGRQTVSLLISAKLSDEDVGSVIEAVLIAGLSLFVIPA
jgi:dTDP-4-amino-4,6-dideoxygalactose transaminase